LVADPGLGTLPDFGNFPRGVDPYGSVAHMLPFARALSAKCYDFGADGGETTIDFARMIRIVSDAGYSGFVGIEYEGDRLPEREGIRAARVLLERTWPAPRSG
jgi:L-ribulose-5-phosphate 3-epimerase